MRRVLDVVPGGLFAVDSGGFLVCWNREMTEITGYSAQEVLGQHCSILGGDTCHEGPCGVAEARCPLFLQQEVVRRRCTLRRKDGSRIPVVKNAQLLCNDDGSTWGGVEVVTDITGIRALEDQVERLRAEASGRSRFHGIIGRHAEMNRLYDLVELAGRTQSSVLVTGDTGTGKELVARAIHERSPRAGKPFIRVSCAALSEALLESELFGHVRGAFTGAHTNRVGRFEAADGGTIFLDEIGDISPAVQTKLLRVLQEREIERVGDNRVIPLDIRVVAATHRDLPALCDAGRFRRDLYYRLAVIPLVVPTLAARASDIPLLVDHFIARLNRTLGRDIRGVTPTAMARMTAYAWPGNVRELEHAIEYGFVVARGALIDDDCLPAHVTAPAAAPPARPTPATMNREDLRRALEQAGGNRARAARMLGVSRVTLWKRLKKAGI
ncbi:MAG: sigma 54-interacting transcriptional regulator [Deltaproteobacteria bacterium]|nr:sigma 54-interacting transcriptional regulator [Deltaproteobacteria bacterium]